MQVRFLQEAFSKYHSSASLITSQNNIIRKNVQIIMRSSDYEVREERKKLIKERYQHLKTLLPFSDADQLKLYDEAMEQIDRLNQQIESRNETQKENIRQKRKQTQDAFWEVTGVSYMMDEFSDSKKKKK
ncbi:MAG: hypothetical protein Q4C50_12595 [Eubacteriales bacterium]|nr:hypothetical protein [Eubacteriales bacterium]